MGSDWQFCPDQASMAWCARQAGESTQAVFDRVQSLLEQLVAHYAGLLALTVTCEQRGWYATRIWGCLAHHGQRLASNGGLDAGSLVARIQRGEIELNSTAGDLFYDVTVAQALELHEPRAAQIFEREFMPGVRLAAHRFGGIRGEELVENFAAELVLPRGERPPRIARYQGRTSLASWLRVVVINHCTSAYRAPSFQPLASDKQPAADEAGTCPSDRKMCQELLAVLMQTALGAMPAEDRLLIRMLLLDGVPQHQLAGAMGIHSGNLTRRRQRLTEVIWQGIQRGADARGQARAATDCLEMVVAGNDRQLSQALAAVIARCLQTAEPRAQGNSPA
jgi:hypothetical protein